ncbi:hypothetical protein WICMUC_000652 [Wickerhamomyces mucosus]|uniref:Low temperature viability protein n=1 Tax=Wickerhamomyces mucosus TaxID=1378264 RepID=A0A9P8TIC7_9ASCO|nr:hypothetical protein WICMUC_000652 [Wickerhamomyces mucosus]
MMLPGKVPSRAMSKKWIDKKRDKTYQVVYRSHDDPLFYDEEAGEGVLVEVTNPNNRKIKTKTQLEKELGDELNNIRGNEGEAAVYGITFDDSKYDYMQHLRPIGNADAVFIPKKGTEKAEKTKGIQFKDELNLPDEMFASKTTVQRTYQDQQDVPDEISGFRPDLNPALREVLEALEDEAYVEEEDDIFEDLLADGEQVDDENFEEQFDEWDMDNYEAEMAQYESKDFAQEGDQGWEADFRKFNAVRKYHKNEWDSDDEFEEDEDDFVPELPSFNNADSSKKGSKRKQRMKKGAMSDTSGFSMSSSALHRTEAMTIIDDQFEQVMKDYHNEDAEEEEEYKPFDMGSERQDLEDLLDDFLDNYEVEGGRRIVPKNEDIHNFKKAADSASKGKLAQKRNKQREIGNLQNSFGNMKLK